MHSVSANLFNAQVPIQIELASCKLRIFQSIRKHLCTENYIPSVRSESSSVFRLHTSFIVCLAYLHFRGAPPSLFGGALDSIHPNCSSINESTYFLAGIFCIIQFDYSFLTSFILLLCTQLRKCVFDPFSTYAHALLLYF